MTLERIQTRNEKYIEQKAIEKTRIRPQALGLPTSQSNKYSCVSFQSQQDTHFCVQSVKYPADIHLFPYKNNIFGLSFLTVRYCAAFLYRDILFFIAMKRVAK